MDLVHSTLVGPCPHCGQRDAIVKVSEAYSRGVFQGNYRGSVVGGEILVAGFMAGNMGGYTELARQLTPPQKPKGPIKWGFWSLGWILLTGVLLGLVLLTGFAFFLSPPADPAVGQGAVSLLILTSLALLVSLVIFSRRSARRRQAAIAAEQRWQRAMELWEHLYYCSRDGMVFLPDNPGRHAPASSLHEWLRLQTV